MDEENFNYFYNRHLKNFYSHSANQHLTNTNSKDSWSLTMFSFRNEDGAAAINIKTPLINWSQNDYATDEWNQKVYDEVQSAFFNKCKYLVRYAAFNDYEVRGRSGGWLVPKPILTSKDIDNPFKGYFIRMSIDNFISLRQQIRSLLKSSLWHIGEIDNETSLQAFCAALEDM